MTGNLRIRRIIWKQETLDYHRQWLVMRAHIRARRKREPLTVSDFEWTLMEIVANGGDWLNVVNFETGNLETLVRWSDADGGAA